MAAFRNDVSSEECITLYCAGNHQWRAKWTILKEITSLTVGLIINYYIIFILYCNDMVITINSY